MYAKYNYTAGTTLLNVISDITAILTGETVVANLSVGCDDANTEILTPYAVAGWSMFDPMANVVGTVLINQVLAVAATDIITVYGNTHTLAANDIVRFGTTAGGVTIGVDYYVMTTSLNQSTGTFRVSSSPNDVGPINLTTTLASVHFWVTSAAQATVFNLASHGLIVDQLISFTGILPPPFVANTNYYVKAVPNANAFTVSDSVGGIDIAATGAGSGTKTLWNGSKVVLRAPVVDDAAFYKYVMLDCSNGTHAQLHLYESWSATAHSGTNQATAIATTGQQRITSGTAGTMLIAASARFIAMQSTTSAGIGDSECNSWTAVFERSRLAPWDNVSNAYPPSLLTRGAAFGFLASGTRYGAACPRFKNPSGGDISGAGAITYGCSMGWTGSPPAAGNTGYGIPGIGAAGGGCGYSGVIKGKVPDGLGGFYTPFNEFQFRNHSYAFEGGSVSIICDVWNTVIYPNNLDEVTKSGVTYIVWQNSLYATLGGFYNFVVGECAGNTVFPKG